MNMMIDLSLTERAAIGVLLKKEAVKLRRETQKWRKVEGRAAHPEDREYACNRAECCEMEARRLEALDQKLIVTIHVD